MGRTAWQVGQGGTISLAWLFYRPLIGVPPLAVAIGLLVWMKTLAAKRAGVKG